jgi:hypothetical protein
MKVGEPLFQNVVNHTRRYVPEELRHRLYRCDSVKGAQSNTTVYYIRK